MDPWIESCGEVLAVLAGVLAGRWLSRQGRAGIVAGYLIPMLLVATIGLARRVPRLEFQPPFSWLLEGRREFALGGVAAAIILSMLAFLTPRPRDRRAVLAFVVIFAAVSSVWPFLAPALNRRFLAAMPTRIDENGVCRQGTDYTCGPAAAVSILRRLGWEAGEGELAILAHTSTAIGTPPDQLAEAVSERYGPCGVHCRYAYFNRVEDLVHDGPALAVIQFGLLVDHYVAVLSTTAAGVELADPFLGHRVVTRAEFERIWRHVGVTITGRRG